MNAYYLLHVVDKAASKIFAERTAEEKTET